MSVQVTPTITTYNYDYLREEFESQRKASSVQRSAQTIGSAFSFDERQARVDPVGIGLGVAGLLGDLSGNPAVSAVGGGVLGVVQSVRSRDPVQAGTGVLGSALNTAANLTGSPAVAAAAEVVDTVGDVVSALPKSSTAAAAYGIGGAASVIGGLLKGTASKVASVVSTAASVVGNALTGALTTAASFAQGVAGPVFATIGALIGGEKGRKFTSVASLGIGAALMTVNPVLGALVIVGGMFGLFGGNTKRQSLLKETIKADLRGDGSDDDRIERGGYKNTLKIKIDKDDGKGAQEAQRIVLSGWFDEPKQARQAQTAELTGDNKPELIWQEKNEVAVFVNRGDGTFGNADYAAERAQLAADYEELKNWLKAIMPPTEKVRCEDWGSTRRERNSKVVNLGELSKEYFRSGGKDAHGEFVEYVAKRSEANGLARPKLLGKLQDGSIAFLFETSRKLPRDDNNETMGVDSVSRALLARANGYCDVLGGHTRGGGRHTSSLSDTVLEKVSLYVDAHLAKFDAQFAGTTTDQHQAARADNALQRLKGERTQISYDLNFKKPSDEAIRDGSGVSLRKQTLPVEISNQRPGQLWFWDINGDGSTDAVFGGEEHVKGVKAFLGRGNGIFDTDSIDLEQPTEQDMQQLVVADSSGRQFVAADFSGTGARDYAFLYQGQWIGLGRDARPTTDEERAALDARRGVVEAARRLDDLIAQQTTASAARTREYAWDVNGDGAIDQVRAENGGFFAYLAGQENDPVDLQNPSDQDWQQLIKQGPRGPEIDFNYNGEDRVRAYLNPTTGQWETR
jgi:hypothetical protein